MDYLSISEDDSNSRLKKISKNKQYILFTVLAIAVSIIIFIICSFIFSSKSKNAIPATPYSSTDKTVKSISPQISSSGFTYISKLNTKQINNAKYIRDYFTNNGWTLQSICGMLGNIQIESGIIADIDEYGGGGGYGLTQWTPKSKLVNWANQQNLNPKLIDTQCRRILWELNNGEQFYKTSAYPLTFKQFSKSQQSPTYLAKVFINNYERPYNSNQPVRGVIAEEWYSYFTGGNNPVVNQGKCLGAVTGSNINDPNNGFAGIFGRPIDSVAVSGGFRYRVHVLGGGWLSEVTGFNTNDSNNGFAGIIGKKIDGFMIKGLKYRCHTVSSGWLSEVDGYNSNDRNNGYAGVFGESIDAIVIHGTKYQVHVT